MIYFCPFQYSIESFVLKEKTWFGKTWFGKTWFGKTWFLFCKTCFLLVWWNFSWIVHFFKSVPVENLICSKNLLKLWLFFENLNYFWQFFITSPLPHAAYFWFFSPPLFFYFTFLKIPINLQPTFYSRFCLLPCGTAILSWKHVHRCLI